MRQTLKWKLKKGPQAVVLETSEEFLLDFMGQRIKCSPSPGIVVLQPTVPVQKGHPVPQRCAAWKKPGKERPKHPSEPAESLSVVPVQQESVPRPLTTLRSAADLGKMWLSTMQSWLLYSCACLGETRAAEHEPALHASSLSVLAVPPAPLTRENHFCCDFKDLFLLVLAMTSARQIFFCSGNMIHNQVIVT